MTARMTTKNTRERLLDSVEAVIREAAGPEDVTVRRIIARADTNISSISYHFTSLERLVVACAMRVYRRLNVERLTELQEAVDAARPGPPEIRRIVRALIGPSLRWSHDPASPYAVFHYLNHLTSLSDHPDSFRDMINDVDHHMTFVHYLHQAAPWFTESQIRWRLTAALGVRSQITRQPTRVEVLTGESLTGDPEHIIDTLCEIIEATFQRPPGPRRKLSDAVPRVSNSV